MSVSAKGNGFSRWLRFFARVFRNPPAWRMTSLAQQLQRLALPQSDPSLLSRDEVASLLFDPKEAATIDRDTAFAIGCTGLEELLGIDPSFEQFEAPLFSQLAKTLERSVQTKAVNKQLDENIKLFLIHLSPYFLLKPAQKCLEWLIHRFHIHLYNQDSLIGCVLPYHETRIFVRVIQLLKITNSKHKWFWLLPVKQSGVPLAKGTLATHCYRDLGFMDFICSLVTKSVKVFATHPGGSAQLRVLLTFYASTLVSALVAAEDISDNIVAKLFPYIQKIIRTLTKIPSLVRDGLGCLIVVLQRQKPESLGKKPFTHLCSVPDLVTLLQRISETHDVGPLLRYMLPHLVTSIIHHITGEEAEELDGQTCRRLLEAVLSSVPLKSGLDHLLARYPRTLDAVLEEHLKEVTDVKKQELFHQFISLSTSGGKYQESIDESFIKEAVLTRLGDESIDVVLSAVNAFEVFKQHFSSEVTVSNLLNLFRRAELSKNRGWYKVLEIAAGILTREEVLRGNGQLSDQVVVHLLPFMVIASDDAESPEVKMAVYLSKSGICSLHPVLRGWREALENVIKSTKPGELIGAANQKMIELLADNIKSGDPSSMLKMEIPSEWHPELMRDRGIPLELWAHYVEQLRAAQSMAVEDAVLLVFSLKNFIHALKRPKSFPEGGAWWNPERLQEDCRGYLRLLLGLFEVVLGAADAAHFRVLMKLFVKVHLEDISQFFRFLSVLWTYGSSLADPLSCKVTAALQTQALYVGRVLLSSQEAPCRHQLASASSPVVPSLLVSLGSPVKEVRRAAALCLQALGGAASHFPLLVEHLVAKAEETTSDATYVVQVDSFAEEMEAR
ncbi:hypothetical protein CB1_000239007 [Camelus ferus]|nr:hypothetical protein CB1_000239007 [Camelus ferus]